MEALGQIGLLLMGIAAIGFVLVRFLEFHPLKGFPMSWLTFGWLKGWRTVAINVAIILASAVDYLDGAGLGSVLPARFAWVPIAIGVLNIVMRAASTTAMGRKE